MFLYCVAFVVECAAVVYASGTIDSSSCSAPTHLDFSCIFCVHCSDRGGVFMLANLFILSVQRCRLQLCCSTHQHVLALLLHMCLHVRLRLLRSASALSSQFTFSSVSFLSSPASCPPPSVGFPVRFLLSV